MRRDAGRGISVRWVKERNAIPPHYVVLPVTAGAAISWITTSVLAVPR
jgi:hypothetical protein